MDDLFALMARPDPALRFRRDETGDPRLGETVLTDPDDYAKAAVVLLGCPQDEGVRRNGGRPGAAAAPDAVRRCLYRLVAREGVVLFDLGNTLVDGSLEAAHSRQGRIVRRALEDGKVVISLGGGNDLAYPDCAALAAVVPDPLAINIDAHLDVRESAQAHSGTPYRQLLTGGHLQPRSFHETAYQSFAVAESHLRWLASIGVRSHSLNSVQIEGVELFYRALIYRADAKAIFWGIDMDAVQASDAPGVSAPNITGLRGEDLLTIARVAGSDARTRVFEITEINPAFDIDQRTCRLAAAAIWTFLAAFYER